MANIKINTTFAGPPGSFLSGAALKPQIIAIPSLVAWIQAAPAHLAVTSGQIDKWLNLKDGSDAFVKLSNTSRAEYTESAGPAAYGSGFFRGGDLSVDGQADAYSSTINIADGAPYTYFAVFRRGPTTTPDQIIGKFTGASVRSILNCAAPSTASLLHGTSGITGPIKENSLWNTLLASFDGSVLRMTVNRVDIEPVIASGSIGSDVLYLGGLGGAGQAFDGNLAEAGVLSSDILSSPREKSLFLDYWQTVYSL